MLPARPSRGAKRRSHLPPCGRIAQLVEQPTLNQRVLGSSPARPPFFQTLTLVYLRLDGASDGHQRRPGPATLPFADFCSSFHSSALAHSAMRRLLLPMRLCLWSAWRNQRGAAYWRKGTRLSLIQWPEKRSRRGANFSSDSISAISKADRPRYRLMRRASSISLRFG